MDMKFELIIPTFCQEGFLPFILENRTAEKVVLRGFSSIADQSCELLLVNPEDYDETLCLCK